MFGGAQPLPMNKNKTRQFLQSFVAIPLLATSIQMTGVPALPSPTIELNQSNNAIQISAITPQEMKIRREHAEKIDQYFKSRNLPLAGYGQKFVEEAVKNDLDYRLLPAIAMRESTGGKNGCKGQDGLNNNFGWGSCRISFDSVDQSIEALAQNLSGNDPDTANHYDGKTTDKILRTYNRVIKNYPKQVLEIMKSIDSDEKIA